MFYTPEEQMQLAARSTAMTTLASEQAKLMAQFSDPNIVRAMIAIKRAELRPEVVPPGSGVLVADPITGEWSMVGGTGQRIKPAEENMQNAAVMQVLADHGQLALAGQFNTNLPYMQQLPENLQSEVARVYEQLKKTPDPQTEMIRMQMQQERDLRMLDIKQRMAEFDATKGPGAIQAAAAMVHQNPDAISEVPGDIRAAVINTMRTSGWRVPKALPEAERQIAYNADQTVQRIQRVADIISKNPDLLGPISGALAKGQAISGVQLFSDPNKAALAEDLIGSLVFLQASEAKAMLGSRPAFQWAKKFEDATANPGQQLPIIQGALQMQLAHARMIQRGVDQLRYGDQKPGAPQPPPGAAQATATMDDVRAYVQTYNAQNPQNPITEAQALQQFTAGGFQVTGK